jgi:hypothetical protein
MSSHTSASRLSELNDACCIYIYAHVFSSRRQYDTPILTLAYVPCPCQAKNPDYLVTGTVTCTFQLAAACMPSIYQGRKQKYWRVPVKVKLYAGLSAQSDTSCRHPAPPGPTQANIVLCLGSACWTYEARALRLQINASLSASKYEIWFSTR